MESEDDEIRPLEEEEEEERKRERKWCCGEQGVGKIQELWNNCVDWNSERKINVGEATKTLFSFKKLWAFMGPGFLVAVAFIDPGNFDTDISAGAKFGYSLIWVLLGATLMGLAIQSLAAKLGLVTEKHLSEHCRDCYSKPMVIVLWMMAEVAVIASDIPEVIGTAFALNLLFNIPLWVGVIITAVDTLLFLMIQYFGVRKLEALIVALLGVISMCFVIEVFLVEPPLDQVLLGFVPTISTSAAYYAIGLVGAVVMPHNIYLHSALVMSRKVPRKRHTIKEAFKYNVIESAIALALSFGINLAILVVAGTEFRGQDDVGLSNASELLDELLPDGKLASIVFAIALLASGQSSTMTGTFAGQFVMEGFLEIKMALWLRNLITRSVAMLPSLIVALIAGDSGSDALIVLSQVILSIQLPFAMIPLIKLTNSQDIMGSFKNHISMVITGWVLSATVIIANFYLLFVNFESVFFGEEAKVSKWWMAPCVVFAVIYFMFLGYLVYVPLKPSPLQREPSSGIEMVDIQLDLPSSIPLRRSPPFSLPSSPV